MTDGKNKKSPKVGWLFPAAMTGAIILSLVVIIPLLGIKGASMGSAMAARLTWGISAMLYFVLFVFAVITLNIVMFRCGRPDDARRAMTWTSVVGLASVLLFALWNGDFFGPAQIEDYLKQTAFNLKGIRLISSAFNGLAVWAGVLTITCSCVIIRNDIENDSGVDKDGKAELLSRQFRGTKILLYTSAVLLIAGIAEISSLYKWPMHEVAGLSDAQKTDIAASALAMSTTVGGIFTLFLAAAYLPLGILLRQRAYVIVKPWERTETWLSIHGFALRPTQQLGKILLVLSPMIAGGPINQVLNLISQSGH